MYDQLLATSRSIPRGDSSRWAMWDAEVRRVESAAVRSEIRRVGLDPWDTSGYLWPREEGVR